MQAERSNAWKIELSFKYRLFRATSENGREGGGREKKQILKQNSGVKFGRNTVYNPIWSVM